MRQLLLQQVKMQRNSGSNTPQKAADHGRGSSANEQQQRRLVRFSLVVCDFFIVVWVDGNKNILAILL